MGGLLAAEIALVFRHRIIGIINFDVPFLGMHPGIVKAGLGSIFSPPPTPQDIIIPDSDTDKKPSRIGTLFNPRPADPNYNPSFTNDVQLPVRKGWENTLHWLSKHYNDGLRQATKGLVKSHLEFGGAMADYRELKDRYAKVRALEEDNESKRRSAVPNTRSVPRVRFVNYYTTTYGRPKNLKSPKSPSPPRPIRAASQSEDHDGSKAAHGHSGEEDRSIDADIADHLPPSAPRTHAGSHQLRPHIDVQEYRDNEMVHVSPQEPLSATSPVSAQTMSSDPSPSLPEIPPIPQEPLFVDLMQYSDKSQRKTAQKEHEKALKDYQKAVKARNKIIIERTKLEEKLERQKQEMSREERQRHIEAEQRLAEARQRQAEAEERQKEAEERQLGTEKVISVPRDEQDTPDVASPDDITGDFSDMGIETPDYRPTSTSSPYASYDFSRSTILSQPPPKDQVSISDSGLTVSTTDEPSSHQLSSDSHAELPMKTRKLKKFCMLPPKDVHGNKDPTWIKVLMKDMDEVTAHTSLFFVNETYERLVGDVGARIEEWVREADSVRLVREMEGLN